MSETFVPNEAGIKAMFTRSDGPVAKALTFAAIKVQRQAKRLCPVDTGHLRGSILWQLIIVGGVLQALIGSDVEYAIYVEMGTWKTQAQPFLRPALASVLGLAPAL